MKHSTFGTICAALLIMCMMCAALSACGNNKKASSLVIEPQLCGEEAYYKVNDEFDSFASTDSGNVCRIPKIYAEYADGSRSEDISHSEKIRYSGYNLSSEGVYTVTVSYAGVSGSYEMTVISDKILFIEASDPFRSTVGCFHVGDKFTTYEVTSEGEERGVTVFVHYASELKPYAGFFTNSSEMAEAEFDTSGCRLDEDGRFTEAGVYTVYVTYKGFSASYSLTVED